jgi:hypothetical protein
MKDWFTNILTLLWTAGRLEYFPEKEGQPVKQEEEI